MKRIRYSFKTSKEKRARQLDERKWREIRRDCIRHMLDEGKKLSEIKSFMRFLGIW